MVNCKNFIIFYEKRVCIVINGDMSFLDANSILNWYAEKYAFERDKLTGVFIDSIEIGYEERREISRD